MSAPSFRDFLFAPDHPRVAEIRGLDAREYAEAAKTDSFAGPMIEGWDALYPQPFKGVTNDGVLRPGLYPAGSGAGRGGSADGGDGGCSAEAAVRRDPG